MKNRLKVVYLCSILSATALGVLSSTNVYAFGGDLFGAERLTYVYENCPPKALCVVEQCRTVEIPWCEVEDDTHQLRYSSMVEPTLPGLFM